MSFVADGSEHHTPSSTAWSQPVNESADEVRLKVHRVRFVDWSPSAVTALAFPPCPYPRPSKSLREESQTKNRITPKANQYGLLAVGRANGNIELCQWTGSETQSQAPQAWVLVKVFASPIPAKVENIVFTIRHPHNLPQNHVPSISDLRLFSSGGGTDLIEWDLNKGLVKRTISSQGGSIWSVAVNPTSTMLAIGCEDGSVRLISLLYGALEHHKRFDRSKSRILSIAWGPPELKMSKPSEDTSMGDDTSSEVDDEDDEGWEDTWLVTGGSDSCIRKWNVKTGRTTDRMETDKARGERTLVWAVQVLADSTIVSGDSMGMVKFWDASTATQFHSFRAHGADVLTLAVSPNGTSIYSAGVDQKVTEFTLSGSTSRRWVQTYSRRLHAHDIRSIAIWPPYTLCTAPKERPLINTGSAPILASGGLDMVVCLTPCAPASQGLEQRIKIVNPLATGNHSTFEESFQRRMAYPATRVLSFAREARFVMCRMNRGITIWRIGSLEDESDRANDVSEPTNWELVLEMELNAKTNLIAGAISADGTWVAVSDAKETKLFRLEDSGKVIPHRIKTFGSVLASANADLAASTASSDLSFTPDSSKLIMSCFPSSFVVIIDLTPSTSNENAAPRVLRTFGQHRIKQARSGRVVKKLVPQRRGDDEEDMEDEQPQANLADNDEDGEGQSEEVHAAVCCTAVSADGQWFASADLRGRCHVFNIDSLQHHCTLPSFELPIRSLVFDPRSSDTLLIGLPNNRIHVFDIEERMFPQWASRVCDNLPQSFTGLHDPLQGLMFVHPSSSSSSFTPSPRQVIAYGSNWLCKIKLDAGVATRKGFRSKDRRKRKTQKSAIEASNEETNEHNFTVVTKYRHMLGVGQLGDQELVIVERPLVDLLSGKGQPPPYYKHRYGT